MPCWVKDASHQRPHSVMPFIWIIQHRQWTIWPIDILEIEAHKETHGNGLLGGGWYKYLKMRKCWQLYNSVNILPATELFHFQWVNFLEISWLFNKHINKEKEKNDTWCTVDSTFMWSRIMMRTWCFPLILKCCFLFYPLEHMAFQQLFQSLLTGCK